MLSVTIWPINRLGASLETLKQIRPGAVQLHANAEQLATYGPKLAAQVRAELPGAEVWFGVASDAHYGVTKRALADLDPGDEKGRARVLDGLQQWRLRAARAAKQIGAARLVLDPETAWKQHAPGFDEAAATELMALTRHEYPGPVLVTSFDCPGYHRAFPWLAFDSCDAWAPQVYAAPKIGTAGIQGAQWRWTLHSKQWRDMGLKPDRVLYLQAHHVQTVGTCWLADKVSDVCLWAIPDRLDADGIRAARVLSEIERRGFSGPGRVGRFQSSVGLNPDGLVGAKTLAALGID